MSEKKVKELWRNKIENIEDSESFNVFIDNPFCSGRCSYCKFNSVDVKNFKKSFEKYYDEYLPKQIEKFSFVFKKRVPDSLYLGGGCPNLLNYGRMKKLFQLIPRFAEIPNRVTEIDPNLMTQRKLDFLTDVNFSYVSLGIQSLKPEVLTEVNRGPYDKKFLKKIINSFRKAGIKVNCDFLVFIGEKTLGEEIKRLLEDLRDIFTYFHTDWVTIYRNCNRLSPIMKDVGEKGIREVDREFRQRVLELSEELGLDCRIKKIQVKEKTDDMVKLSSNAIKVTRINFEEFNRIHKYSCSVGPGYKPGQNVLALGGFRDKKPWSYLGDKVQYWTANVDWEPVYELNT